MNPWWLLVCLALFLIGVTKSGFGAGVGLMIVPLTTIAMGHIPGRGSEAALGLMLPLLVLGDLIAVWQYRRFFSWRKTPLPVTASASPAPATGDNAPDDAPAEAAPRAMSLIGRLLPGSALGVLIGGAILAWFSRQTQMVGGLMRIEIGCECILLVGLHWWRALRGVQQHLLREPVRSHLTGTFAGASSTLAHAAGPIVTMYLLPLRLDRQLYVGVTAIYFFLLNTAKLPVYWQAGQFARAELSFTLRFLPLVVAGAIFGRWINQRLNDRLFTRVVYFLTFLLGWYVLADGIHLLRRLP